MRSITIRLSDEQYDKLIYARNTINKNISEMFIHAKQCTISDIVRDSIDIFLNQYLTK